MAETTRLRPCRAGLARVSKASQAEEEVVHLKMLSPHKSMCKQSRRNSPHEIQESHRARRN
jgi:hypothetical protein